MGFDVTELRRLLDMGGIRAVYQPIVALQSLEPVAYEALARGPAGSSLESPERLFATAGAAGLRPAVDRACRAAAIDGAVRSPQTDPFTLFVNVEPDALEGSPLFEPAQQERILRDRVRVVAELDERALIADPAQVLAAVAWLRRRGAGIALDNVGVDRRSLALLPLARPDIVKLDMQLVHEAPSASTAEIASAVGADAERSGAQVLAVGIETAEHLRRAIALGARLGQGWMFGRPDALPDAPARRAVLKARRRVSPETVRTPFRIVSHNQDLSRGSKLVLLERSMLLEAEAAALGADAMVLSTFQDARYFGPAARARYAQLAERAGLVAAFGAGMDDEPAPGVRGAAIDAEDPLRHEWNVIVLSPKTAVAFVARELDEALEGSRRFEFSMTYDRELVLAATNALMAKLVTRLAQPEDEPAWLGQPSAAASRA